MMVERSADRRGDDRRSLKSRRSRNIPSLERRQGDRRLEERREDEE